MATRSAYPMPVLNASRVFGIPVLLDGSKPYFESDQFSGGGPLLQRAGAATKCWPFVRREG